MFNDLSFDARQNVLMSNVVADGNEGFRLTNVYSDSIVGIDLRRCCCECWLVELLGYHSGGVFHLQVFDCVV